MSGSEILRRRSTSVETLQLREMFKLLKGMAPAIMLMEHQLIMSDSYQAGKTKLLTMRELACPQGMLPIKITRLFLSLITPKLWRRDMLSLQDMRKELNKDSHTYNNNEWWSIKALMVKIR